MGALTEEEAKAIETVPHYTHDEEQAYCMLYGEGVFDTIPIEASLSTMIVHPRQPPPSPPPPPPPPPPVPKRSPWRRPIAGRLHGGGHEAVAQGPQGQGPG